MKTTGGEPSPESNQRDEADNVVGVARAYFATNFPNPNRLGCPPRDELAEVAGSGQLPGDELRAHLVSCSACFNDYREAKAASPRRVVQEGASVWSRLVNSLTGMRAAAYGLLAIVLMAFLILAIRMWRTRAPEPQTRQHIETPAPSNDSANANAQADRRIETPTVNENRASASSATQNANANRDHRPAQLAMNYVEIDLEGRTPSRDASQSAEPIRLAAAINQLRLRLPEGSAKGLYAVSIRDAFGKPLIAGKNQPSGGKTLDAVLDMRRLAHGNYTLCIARARDELPDCYTLIVSRAKAAPAPQSNR